MRLFNFPYPFNFICIISFLNSSDGNDGMTTSLNVCK